MSDESDLVAALRVLANAGGDSTFRMKWKDATFTVEYSGGSSSSLTLVATYDTAAQLSKQEPRPKAAGYRESAKDGKLVAIRPMNIQLRPETTDDADDKASGVSREHQTGDHEFDRDVYVDSESADDVLSAVLCEPVRSGARQLIKLGLKLVVIDDVLGRVTASMSEFTRPGDQSLRAKEICNAFALLLSGLPPVARAAAFHPGKPMGCILPIGGVLACILGFGLPAWFFLVAAALDCTEGSADGEGSSLKDGCGSSVVAGAVVAFTAAFIAVLLVRAPLRNVLSGRSDSGSRLRNGMIIAGALTFAIVFLATSGIVMARR